jgi:long-chain acyl-CoA synthetase
MYPGEYARTTPHKAAAINAATGATLTYGELDQRSNQLAQFLSRQGLRPGDHIALCMENNLRFFEVAWAALRSGLYITTINRYLTADEAAYIINDCQARALVVSYAMREVAAQLPPLIADCGLRLMSDGSVAGWTGYEDTIAAQPAEPLTEQPLGDSMLYSSGTTGRPKGIKRPLTGKPVSEGTRACERLRAYGFGTETVYLSPAPLYHSAPFGFTVGTQSLGGTVVVMPRFDAREALRLIEAYRVTHSQWVPTMFVRMLKLPEADRQGWDLSSHQVAVHAAAPCPVEVKRRMIDWWGPILLEYYAGTEGNGSTLITSAEWLQRPGSVGRAARGIIHICDDEGHELPTGEAGLIYFEQDVMSFEYHNDPDKTRAAQHPEHANWSTLGDVGYLDDAGYLYLTDRKAFMIISGGVNIYPQEVEDILVVHPDVTDVAVFGVPNDDFGEEVKAVVQPRAGVEAGEALAQALIAYARERLAHYMVPRSIDFIDELPRLPTGKLYKRVLRDRYWAEHKTKIV